MNRYERYKESGIPWLGEVPAHWSIVGISKLFMLKAGGDLQPDFFSREKDDEHCYPIYTNANDEHAVYGYTSKKRFNADSITVSGRGDIGFAVYRDHDFDAIIRLLVLSPLKKFDCKYYTYSINARLDFKFESSAVAQLSTVQLAQYKLLLPDYDEQTAIAHYLDTKLGEIDALIDKQQTLLEKLAEQRTAVITHAVTKGLNPAAPMKKSGVEWLGDVPAHWDVKRLKFLGDIILGLTYSPENITNEDNGTVVLRSSNIQNGKLVYEDNVFVNSDIPKRMVTTDKDILICSRNGSRSLIGKCALIEKDGLNQTFGAFMTVYRTPYRKFVYYSLNSEIFKSQLGLFLTSTINQLTTQVLGNFNIAFPPLEEQSSITEYLDNETAKIDRLCETVNQTIGRLKEYRTALITQAVTGKVKVTDE